MAKGEYTVFSGVNEDIFGFPVTLDEAERLAVRLLRDGSAEGPLLIELNGLVVRQYVTRPGGAIEETTGASSLTGHAERRAG